MNRGDYQRRCLSISPATLSFYSRKSSLSITQCPPLLAGEQYCARYNGYCPKCFILYCNAIPPDLHYISLSLCLLPSLSVSTLEATGCPSASQPLKQQVLHLQPTPTPIPKLTQSPEPYPLTHPNPLPQNPPKPPHNVPHRHPLPPRLRARHRRQQRPLPRRSVPGKRRPRRPPRGGTVLRRLLRGRGSPPDGRRQRRVPSAGRRPRGGGAAAGGIGPRGGGGG